MEEGLSDYLPTNYAFACNSMILPSNAQIKKLQLERTDILVLIHGVSFIHL